MSPGFFIIAIIATIVVTGIHICFFHNCHNCNNCVIRSQLYPFFQNCYNCNNCALKGSIYIFFFKIAIIATIVVTRCIFCAIFSWQLYFPTILCYYRYCELSNHIAIIALAFVYSVLLLQFLYFRIARKSTTLTKGCYFSNYGTIIAQNCTTWTYDLHNCWDNCISLLFCAIIAIVSYRAFMLLWSNELGSDRVYLSKFSILKLRFLLTKLVNWPLFDPVLLYNDPKMYYGLARSSSDRVQLFSSNMTFLGILTSEWFWYMVGSVL